MDKYLLLFLIWIICAVLSHGILFAWCQRHPPKYLAEQNYRQDIICSIVIGLLLGPIALVIIIALLTMHDDGKFHGFKLW